MSKSSRRLKSWNNRQADRALCSEEFLNVKALKQQEEYGKKYSYMAIRGKMVKVQEDFGKK